MAEQAAARQRANLAAAHAEDLEAQAARAYAAAALAAFRAAALRTSPLDVLHPLRPKEATRGHCRRPAAPARPAPRRRSRYVRLTAAKPELPGSKLAALADFLRRHTNSGLLMRRLHPVAEPPDRA